MSKPATNKEVTKIVSEQIKEGRGLGLGKKASDAKKETSAKKTAEAKRIEEDSKLTKKVDAVKEATRKNIAASLLSDETEAQPTAPVLRAMPTTKPKASNTTEEGLKKLPTGLSLDSVLEVHNVQQQAEDLALSFFKK